MRLWLMLLVITALWPAAGVAQAVADARQAAFYQVAQPGEPSITVSVWGDVKAAGRYEVKAGTGLVELLFLAGGPSERAMTTREERTTILRLSRKGQEGWTVLKEVPLEQVGHHEVVDLVLADEDILKVETRIRQRPTIRDVLSIVGTVGTLTLVVDRVFFRGR